MLKRPPELLDVFMAFNNNRDWKQYGSPRDYDGIIWKDQPTLTREQVETKLAELQAEYDAEQYARNREKEYPNWQEFAEAYSEKEIGGDSTKWDEYVIKYNKVRTDNPKS